jgi:hypothetical protein
MVKEMLRHLVKTFFLYCEVWYMVYYLIQFLLTFIVVFLGYYFLVVRKTKEFDKNSCPMEVTYIMKKYKLNIKKLNYHQLLKLIAIINAIIVALTCLIVALVDLLLLELLLGFFVLIPLIIISYDIVGKCYRKKGMTDDV